MIPRSPRAFDARVLAAADGWGAGRVGVAVIDRAGLVATSGQAAAPLPWASVTKMVTAYTVLIAVRRGVLALEDPAGPPGATVRHLLAHAAGLAFDGPVALSPPERTRIYSNAGIDAAAGLTATRAGRPFTALLREWVLDPLSMTGTSLAGPPSHGLVGSLDDLAAFGHELLRPRLLPESVLVEATTVAYPGLRGVLPGVGRFDPLDWGLGFEVRDAKTPHWTGTRNSPRTFGHFGGSGTFLWVDPDAGIGLACLTERTFGPWALDAWPALSDAVLTAAGS